MPPQVKLSIIVDGLDMQSDEFTQYLDRKTGKLVAISEEVRLRTEDADEDTPDLSDWEQEEAEIARRIDEGDENYLALPSKFDVHEWDIMRRFCGTVEDAALQDQLLNAIHGTGAFRMFKDCIHRRGIADQWYRYRNETFKQIAIDWCQENEIEYEDDVQPPAQSD